jgi:hypothetical protein
MESARIAMGHAQNREMRAIKVDWWVKARATCKFLHFIVLLL